MLTEEPSAVYGSGGASDGSLIPNTQSILRDLARVSQDLTDFFRTHFQGSVSRASRMAQRLMISYHHVSGVARRCFRRRPRTEPTQCVVLTTRPLVMCALQMHVENADAQTPETIPLTPPVRSLLQSCVDSAQTELRMMRALADEDLLGKDCGTTGLSPF